jgi:hypothetical protein
VNHETKIEGVSSMNNILANILPQEGEGLSVKASSGYNAAIALSGLLAIVGVAFGVHAFFSGLP